MYNDMKIATIYIIYYIPVALHILSLVLTTMKATFHHYKFVFFCFLLVVVVVFFSNETPEG